MNNFYFYYLISLLCFSSTVSSSNILVVSPIATTSHFKVGEAIAIGLGNAGHKVTILSAYDYKAKNSSNIESIQIVGAIEKSEEMKKHFDSRGLDAFEKMPISVTISILLYHGADICNTTLHNPNVIPLYGRSFDLVIIEIFGTESLIGLGEHFDAPVIGYSTFASSRWTNDLMGNPSPLSWISHPMLDFPDKMDFLHRMYNTMFYMYESLFLKFLHHPMQRSVYNLAFPNAKLSYDDARKNVALTFVNTHFSLARPLPYVPNIIEVGGMHVNRKIAPLPPTTLYNEFHRLQVALSYKNFPRNFNKLSGKHFVTKCGLKWDIKKFIESAQNGIIYFSFGSILKSEKLEIEKRDAFINVFSKLKQKIIWKFEDPTVTMPKNVFTSNWLPQTDILAHSNIKAFISHGGLLGSTEAVYYGVPILGIPFFGDQKLNIRRASQTGWAVTLDYNNISTSSVEWALNEILKEKYIQKAREVSKWYRDQPMTPAETMVYWSEYVIRHKGATHLRSLGLDLNYVQYHNLDVLAVLIGGLVFIFYITKWLCSRICGKKTKIERNSSKKYQ